MTRVVPPSREAWLADGELHGHTVEQTVRWLSDTADYADAQQQRAVREGAVPADAERPSWWRRLVGR